MSKPAASAGMLAPATQTSCCPPMAAQRLEPATALQLAPAFKALGDPVRLQASGERFVRDVDSEEPAQWFPSLLHAEDQ